MGDDPTRGSRKHILDLVAGPDFPDKLNDLLADTGVVLQGFAQFQPRGKNGDESEEWTLRKFLKSIDEGLPPDGYGCFDKWWVPDIYKNPTWDLLAECRIDGRPGLLLVEAKAHEAELDWKGKPLSGKASDQSQKNHTRITDCINQARESLTNYWREKHGPDEFGISVDTHYQLSNRVASAWKLAECGFDVALLYLGFTGDVGMSNVGQPFTGPDHWQRVMGCYMKDVVPLSLPGKVYDSQGLGSIRFLIGSLPIMKVSPKP